MTTANGLSSKLYGDNGGVGHQINRERIGVITATGNITLTRQYRSRLRIDPGGATRTVTLPAEAGADGMEFEIYNSADDAAELLTVQDDTPTAIESLGRGEKAVFICDGSSWYSMGVTASAETRIRVQKTTISTAQVLALQTTPITIVSAPGAGKFIEFVSASLLLDYNSAAYGAVAGGDDLEIRYTDGSGVVVANQELTGFIDQTNDELRILSPAGTAVATDDDIVPAVNAVLVAFLSGAITTGDSPLIVECLYRVRDSTP